MYDVASLVGDALREMQRRDAPFLAQSSIEANSNILVGGQIGKELPRLFHVYAQGNFIEASWASRNTASRSSTVSSPWRRRRRRRPNAC